MLVDGMCHLQTTIIYFFAHLNELVFSWTSGANAQNNTAGPISQSPVPGNPVVSMPATNLNMGMDLWNASSASAEAAKMRHSQSGAHGAGGHGEQWMQQVRVP